MLDLFSDEMRRDPFAVYDQLRNNSPAFKVPPPFDAWMIFDYDGVKRALNDHETFSSCVPAPRHWFIFFDPPQHTKLRALISRAFTPSVASALEARVQALSSNLLDGIVDRGEIDLAADFAVPLPMMVIAELIGIPSADWARFSGWSNVILRLSYTRSGGEEAVQAGVDFTAVTVEMNDYLTTMIAERRAAPKDDLLTRLVEAEVEGEKLTQEEILGFFQLLIVAGQETTTNLINNTVLCLIEHPGELARLQETPALLPSAIEEVLRYRSPIQWMMRTPRRDIEMHGQSIPAGALLLPMIGSANRDPKHFPDANRFDITRDPNPHLAFGHGIHSCLGAALARMEARVALSNLLDRVEQIELASTEPWVPRKALQVYGPSRLPIRFQPRGDFNAGDSQD
jgi:cytochrome P450